MIKYIKNELKHLPMTILICIVFYGIVTIATSNINSNDIIFDNTNSNLNAGDMQEAIDEVFQHATDYNEIKTTIGDSTLTTTNQTLTGAVNEVNDKITTVNGKLIYFALGPNVSKTIAVPTNFSAIITGAADADRYAQYYVYSGTVIPLHKSTSSLLSVTRSGNNLIISNTDSIRNYNCQLSICS